MKKRVSVSLCALSGAALLAFGSMGISAYLTDRESANNVFTLGDVQIDLVEPNFPGNESDEVKDLVPNHSVAKDPHVINTGDNDALVFMKLTVPKETVHLRNNDGTDATGGTGTVLTELFKLKTATGTNTYSDLTGDNGLAVDGNINGWVLLSKDESETAANSYVFGYNSILNPAEGDYNYQDQDVNQNNGSAVTTVNPATAKTSNLFDKVILKNIIEDDLKADAEEVIKIDAYAIQADGILDENDNDLLAGITGDISGDLLRQIYNVYANQSGALEDVNAKGNNEYGIPGSNELPTSGTGSHS